MMRTTRYLPLALSAFLLVSCGSDDSKSSSTKFLGSCTSTVASFTDCESWTVKTLGPDRTTDEERAGRKLICQMLSGEWSSSKCATDVGYGVCVSSDESNGSTIEKERVFLDGYDVSNAQSTCESDGGVYTAPASL